MPLRILLFCCLISPLFGMAQISLDAHFQNKPLQKVLQSLEQDYELVFSYTQDVLEDQFITVDFERKSLKDALTLIFVSTSVDFKVVKDNYVILKRKENYNDALTLQICGKIRAASGEPLAFASIFSGKSKQGITTEEDGTFRWSAPFNSTDTIEISYVGFQPIKRQVADLLSCPEISLSLPNYSFAEIVVKEYVTSGIEQSEDLDHVVLRPQKIDVVPGLTEADVLQMVQILPGVQSLDETATGLHIRGGTPDQNLILWDGIPVYNSGHFFGMISAFNPYIVDEVKVYRSGFGPEYGGRVSGVVDIRSEQQIPDGIKVNAGINFTHADASLIIPFTKQKSALTLSARRAYTDIIESPTYKKLSERVFQRGKIDDAQNLVEEGEDIDTDLKFVFNDVNVKWLWQPDKFNKVAISAFGISDQLNFDAANFEIVTKDDLDLRNGGVSGQWHRQWHPNLTSALSLSYTEMENNYQSVFGEVDTSGTRLDYRQTNNIQDFTLRWDYQWKGINYLPIEFGYHLTDLSVERKWEFEENPADITVDQNNIHTGHISVKPHWEQRWRSSFGLRWNYATALEQSFFEPRFSLQFLPTKQLQFRATAGLYRQFISQFIEFNDLGLNQQTWALADDKEDIPIAKGTHYSAGFIFHPSDFQLEIEAYHKRLFNLTSFSPVFLESFQEENYSEGTGTVWGVDLLLKKRWKKYQAWLSYTFSRVKYTFETYNNNRPFAAPHDRPHVLTFVQQYKFKQWSFSLNWQFASGRVYTAADQIRIEDDEAFPVYDYDRTNVNRLAPFHRLDMSVLYQLFSRKDRLHGKIGLSVLNFYNRRNELSRQYFAFYDEEDEEFILEALDRPMLGFTPNLVFRISWN